MSNAKGGNSVKRNHKLRRAGATLAAWLVIGVGPAEAVFDDLEYSPRARAMGGAYAAISDDASALFYNPAGLIHVNSYDLQGVFFEPWNLGFVRANAISFALPLREGWGSAGIGYTDFRAENDGTVLSIERTVTVAHGFTLMEDIGSTFAFGYALNLYNIDYPTPSVSGLELGSQSTFGLDVGFLVKLRGRTQAGAFIKNVNNPSIGEPVETDLKQRLSGGFAYSPYDGVITTVELEKELGEDTQFHGGVEARISDPLYLRFGAQSKPNLFDAGVGLVWQQVRVDLTYTHHPIFDSTFRYGLRLSF